jgi:hypothetical protein
VYLFAANTTGYGGAGFAASSSNASVSLLSAAETGTSDAVGAYVATGSNGGFSLTGDYTCTSGQQLYLYALGGGNAAAGLMAAIGSCPASGSSAITVTVNEVSTIAAAYSFAGFATDATHVSSSGTALAQTGIANAFANVANLETLSTGNALATTPAGNGLVPQANINTLADILAACVNSSSPSSSGCSTLFTNAMSAGSTGTTATDTATAAINIAHYPGTNIAALYALPIATPPFAPPLTAQPNDFTIRLGFSGGGLNQPGSIAIDGAGNAWTANYYGNSVSELSSAGAALSPSTGYTGGGLTGPNSIAIDVSGDAWMANDFSVSKLSNAGTALSPSTGYTGGGLDNPNSVAIDGAGDAWMTNVNGVSKLSNAGTALSPSTGYTGGGLDNPSSIAIDGSGDAWIAGVFSPDVSEFSNAGTALSPSSGYSGGGLYQPHSIAIDGLGNAWTANYEGVSKFSSAGTPLSPSIGYTGGGLANNPSSIAIDGSGNAWIANPYGNIVSELSNAGTPLSPSTGYTGGGLTGPNSIAIDVSGDVWLSSNSDIVSEIIGVATPVITPICAGLPATPTANGTSNLGTRP